jgi:hypothetical protein
MTTLTKHVSSHGRVLHYVLDSGECRPALGVKRHDGDHEVANLAVFTDADDDDLMPLLWRKGARHVKPVRPERAKDAEEDSPVEREPGTWHWPGDCEG